MTKEQIKQIAEEYLLDITGKVDKNYSHEFQNFLSWMEKRYCIVERSKVEALEAEIHCAIMDAHNDDDMQMVAHEVLDVMPRRFAAVFGSETFNKKEL